MFRALDRSAISFRPLETGIRGTAELSTIYEEDMVSMVKEYPILSTGDWYFFNRLYVQPARRNEGHAHCMMKQLVSYVDLNKISILNTLNPYGDLDLVQLIKFYTKYGFKLLPRQDSVMVRTHKGITYTIK